MKKQKDFALDLAREAGDIIQQYFRSDEDEKQWKNDDTPVTIADKKINDLVKKRVEETFPDHGFLGEEGGEPDGQKYVWVCDPIDGTRAYSRGIASSTFSLALVKDGEPVLGVVYQPFLSEMYFAVKDQGAFCNGEKIEVSRVSQPDHKTLIAAPAFKDRAHFNIDDKLKSYSKLGVNIYNYGSAAYNAILVARGSADMTFFPWSSVWDIAAAKVIIEEAGGHTSDIEGNDQNYDSEIRGFIGTNGVLSAV